MVIAQAIVEHGVLDSLTSGIGAAFDGMTYYATQPGAAWVGVGIILFLAWLFLRPAK
jgi:hypothetical protein